MRQFMSTCAEPLNVHITQAEVANYPIVELTVQVGNAECRPVPGLGDSSFAVTEQGENEAVPTGVSITVDQPSLTLPLKAVLVLDRSGSMDVSTNPACVPEMIVPTCPVENNCPAEPRRIDASKDAAKTFVDSLQSDDRAAVVSFADTPSLDGEPTSDKTELKEAIDGIKTSCPGGTALYDAVCFAIDQFTTPSGISAVIVLSDGGDNASSHTFAEACACAQAARVPVYTIAAFGSLAPEDKLRMEDLAECSGGQFYDEETADELTALYARIGEAIRGQYRIRYTAPNNLGTGEERTVSVTANMGGATSSATVSYRYARELLLDTPTEFDVGDVTWLWNLNVPEGTPNLFALLKKTTTTGEGWQPRGYGQYGWRGSMTLLHEGQVVGSDTGYRDFAIHIPNPTPGRYTIEVTSETPGAGRMAALTSLRELTLGEWATGTILRSWGSTWYQLQVPSGVEALFFKVETLGIWSPLDVYQGILRRGPSWTAAGEAVSLSIPNPVPGTYYVDFTDSAIIWAVNNQPAQEQLREFQIRADVNPIVTVPSSDTILTGLLPSGGSNNGVVTIKLTGRNLDPMAHISLQRAGEPPIHGNGNIGTEEQHELTTTLNLLGATPGAWSLVVVSRNAGTVELPNAFAIEGFVEAASVFLDVVGRTQVRAGRRATYHAVVENRSNVDQHDLILLIACPIASKPRLEVLYPDIGLDAVGLTWNDVPMGAEIDGVLTIPFWIIKLAAQTKYSLSFSLLPPIEWVGQPQTITAQLLEIRRSRFSETGEISQIETSPVFEAIHGLFDDEIARIPSAMFERQENGALGFVEGSLKTELVRIWDTGVPQATMRGGQIGGIAGAVIGCLLCVGGEVIGCRLCALAGGALGRWLGIQTGLLASFVHRMHMDAIRQLDKTLEFTPVSSVTPEDKFGATGYSWSDSGNVSLGTFRFVDVKRQLPYRVEFWNKEDATAPAQEVFVEDQLDEDLDWTTFTFDEIGFLRWKIELEGGQYFSVNVDMRPDMNLIVNVEGTFDIDTGKINWIFRSLDPATRQPPADPLAGFLPPITDSGYEIGWVEFTVRPKAGLPTGAQITNQALVNFDGIGPWNKAPKDPPDGLGPWLNTIDAGAPTSSVQPLDAMQFGTTFTVSWSGQDDEGGSGIRDFTIYVAEDDGPYSVWLNQTRETSASFAGQVGHKYAFVSKARDNVGNEEPAPSATTPAQASTTVLPADIAPGRGVSPCGACGAGAAAMIFASMCILAIVRIRPGRRSSGDQRAKRG